MWIKHATHNQWRCPCCALEYRPWSTARGQIEAQKVLTMTCPMSGETRYIPMIWPSGAEDGFLMRAVEDKAQEYISLDAFEAATTEQNLQKIEDLAQRVGAPKVFGHIAWEPWVEDRLDPGHYPRSQWQHLKDAGGVWGAKMDLTAPDFKAWSDMPELISLLGQSLAAGRRAARL